MKAGTAVLLTPLLLLAACSAVAEAEPAAQVPSPAVATPMATTSAPAPEPPVEVTPVVLASDGRPRPARMSIRALGVSDLRVVPYVGTPDDRPGTAIQDRGFAATPHGSGGLVGPGGIGNYLVTGHRTSSTAPFADLPSLRAGDRVVVVTGRHRLVYEIIGTRSTSFRSLRSLRAQSAAVPGRPGRTPTRAMITLSTCATPEDHAVGNYWSDALHNPEHRIEKIGVLRSIDAGLAVS